MYPLSSLVAKVSYFLFLGILLLNLGQKRAGREGIQKRTATLYLGLAVFVIYLGSTAILHSPRLFRLSLPDLLVLPFLLIVAFTVYLKRKKTFPFRKTCVQCGTPLTMNQIILVDSNLCTACGNQHSTTSEAEQKSHKPF
ncbi:MAG: hypothetical protein SNJ78_02825 [Spirochaetales bacterium]